MRELLALWLLKWYTVCIRTGLRIYGQIYPFAIRSSLGLRPWELLQAKGYICPYIPPLVLIWIQDAWSLNQPMTRCGEFKNKIKKICLDSLLFKEEESSRGLLSSTKVVFFWSDFNETLVFQKNWGHWFKSKLCWVFDLLPYCWSHLSYYISCSLSC